MLKLKDFLKFLESNLHFIDDQLKSKMIKQFVYTSLYNQKEANLNTFYL